MSSRFCRSEPQADLAVVAHAAVHKQRHELAVRKRAIWVAVGGLHVQGATRPDLHKLTQHTDLHT